ncbi:hypothetical protein PDJ28_25365 [Bacillus cereus group sp. TH160LC]|nr:hypothetical protein [Bacillus cereus group sp. TH160LC]MDA1652677.1 hypothetical protein [Bacillus cereus group sp. TH160LC]
MREAIEEYIEYLQQSAVENRKEADKAYEAEDLGLAGFYRGKWIANEGTAIALTTILSEYKNHEMTEFQGNVFANYTTEKRENDMKYTQHGTFEVTQLLAEAKENEENDN